MDTHARAHAHTHTHTHTHTYAIVTDSDDYIMFLTNGWVPNNNDSNNMKHSESANLRLCR